MTTTLPPKLGRYEVLEEIGKGAMGVVYLARDPLIGRLVALKTFRVGFTAKDEELVQFRSRFVREAQSAGILSHPNIVTIHDVVDEGGSGTCFIAMEYVKGTNLKHLLQRTEPLAHSFVVDVVSQIADALDYAHSRGVIHRDIKPANILITADNRVKITDFGIARMDTSNLTMEGQLLGTPNYMAPEQIQGKDVDHRADIFSLGVVFYELLTRRKPFQGENLTQVTHKIVYEPFTPPEDVVEGLPAGLSAVLGRCLQKDPNRRYPRATEVAKELRAVLEQQESLEDTVGTMEVEPQEPAPDQAPTRQLDRAAVLASAAAAPPPAPAVDSSPTRKLDRVATPVPVPAAAPDQPAAAQPAAAPGRAVTPKPQPAAPMTPKPSPPPPAAPARGAAQEPKARAPGRKGLWIALAGLAAAAVVAVIGVWALGGEEPAPARPIPVAPSPSPEQQNRITAATALSEARTKFTSGDLDGALAAIARAELAEPDNLEVQALRGTIESGQRQQAAEAERERQIGEGLAAASAAMSSGSWQEAIVAARGVLAVDPEREEARTILADAQRAQRREREQADAAARAAAAATTVPAPQPAAMSETPAPPVASATDAPLKIEFGSDLSEGVLTIYAGERQIVREPFRFVRKSGLFSREKISGTLEAQRRIPVGPLMLRVYVAIPGSPTKAVALEKEIRGGVSYRLVVRVDAEGRTTAELR